MDGSRSRVRNGWKGMTIMTRQQKGHVLSTQKKQRDIYNRKLGEAITSLSSYSLPPMIYFPTRLYILKALENPPPKHPKLRTKCSNTWAHRVSLIQLSEAIFIFLYAPGGSLQVHLSDLELSSLQNHKPDKRLFLIKSPFLIILL